MRVLVDTNVVLDYLAKREPFLKSAEAIFEACAAGKIDGYVAAHSFSNIFYILRNVFSIAERRSLLLDLCRLFSVTSVDQLIIESAIKNESIDDFEDALQEGCATSIAADYIITRDPADYAQSVIPVISPDKFIASLK